MKLTHNKKRNTLFLYEALVREYTKAKLDKDSSKIKEIQVLIFEFFSEGKILNDELRVYKAISDTKETDKELAERILSEAKRVYSQFNQEEIFNEQSSLISKINKKIGPKFFSNYVPNYKSLATIQQIFGQKTDIPSRMLLERQVIETMVSPKETIQEINEKIDKYVIHSFLNAFNKKYSDLLPEQKMLLKQYMVSSEEDNTDFIIFINEEMQKIAEKLNNASSLSEIKEDKDMVKKLNEAKNKFEKLKNGDFDEKFLQKMLKYQKLVYELEN